MGIPQARKPDRTFRHTRPRTAMAAHGSPPSHRTMRHRDHATCTSITLDGPAPAGARRSLEHHATRDALPPQAPCSPVTAAAGIQPSKPPRKQLPHPQRASPSTAPAGVTSLHQHRGSHRSTCTRHAATRSARHSARDDPLGFPRSCQPRPSSQPHRHATRRIRRPVGHHPTRSTKLSAAACSA